MPRISYLQANFTAGEISPKLYGRGDLDKYANSVKLMENAFPLIYGGARKHPGSRFVGEVKNSADKVRLFPFIFSRDQAYVVEAGPGYFRFHTAAGPLLDGGATVEVATPYTAGDLFELEYTQGADSMFLTHQDIFPQRLLRIASNKFQMGDLPFDVTPFKEWGTRPAATLSLSSPLGGINVTASASVFLTSDVGRRIVAGSGIAIITSYVSGTQVTATVTSTFDATVYPVNAWKMDLSPQVAVSPSAASPEGLAVTVTAHGDPVIVSSYSWSAGVLTLNTATPHGLTTSDRAVLVGFESSGLNGTYAVASTPTGSQFTIAFATQVQQGGLLGIVYKFGAGSAWRTADVGSFVRINGGLVQITGFVSDAIVNGVIVKEMQANIAAPPDGWSLESGVWNSIDGYPRAVTLHQQRLIFGGSFGYPRTIWGSKTAAYFDFTLGTADDDALSFDLASSDSVDQIAHIYSMRRLVIQTFGGEFVGGGSVTGNSALTPTNIQIDPNTTFGCNQVKPVRVGSELLFVQRSGRKLRALAYDINSDAYAAEDLSRLAEHITEGGIVDMAYQQEPYTVVWAVRADGVLLSVTYDKGQGVTSWARKLTDGVFESVACIPAGDHDDVYVSVRRAANGGMRRYVERLDDALQLDCALTMTALSPQTVWTGLSHLNGKSVAVRGDGTYRGLHTVSGGSITLTDSAVSIEVGLFFAPRLQLLNPIVNTPTGSSMISAENTSEVTVQFLESAACTVNGQIIPFRNFGSMLLDQPIPLFTGYHRIENMDPWQRGETPVEISQDEPMPFHILSVTRRMTAND